AVVGTGLIGTSVALAAGRAGTRCRGFDADPGVLRGAASRGAVEPAPALAEAVADAELVVVAVPVGAAPAVVREVLGAAAPSHLPHALANLLMLRVAEAAAEDDAPLAFAGASLREMTRLAGANAAVWSDIFLGNADEIAAALGGLRASLDELEQALQAGDRE